MVNQVSKQGNIVSIRMLGHLKQVMVNDNEGLVSREKLELAEMTAKREDETLSKVRDANHAAALGTEAGSGSSRYCLLIEISGD